MDKKKLRLYAENNFNVMFIGSHGIGKTALIKELWDEMGLKWKYFSAATMDPWVDFIGVPREVKDENGVTYLDLIRPRDFAYDNIEAIFMDEFNRAPKKVRNAVMELVQFKTINGRPYKNLKMIWTACNPPSDTDFSYDVETMDPAQEDRFEIYIHLPALPDKEYFVNNYGSKGELAIEWWSNLPIESRTKVSPRRLEYALKVINVNGDVNDVLHSSTNPARFVELLNKGSITKQLEDLFQRKATKEAEKFLASRPNFEAARKYIIGKDATKNYPDFFIPLLNSEDVAKDMTTNYPTVKSCCSLYHKSEKVQVMIDSILETNASANLKENITRELRSMVPRLSELEFTKPFPSDLLNVTKDSYNYDTAEERIKDAETPYEKLLVIEEIYNYISAATSDVDAERILKAVNRFCNDSLFSTVRNEKERLSHIVGACLGILNKDTREVLKNYASLYKSFWIAGIIS